MIELDSALIDSCDQLDLLGNLLVAIECSSTSRLGNRTDNVVETTSGSVFWYSNFCCKVIVERD